MQTGRLAGPLAIVVDSSERSLLLIFVWSAKPPGFHPSIAFTALDMALGQGAEFHVPSIQHCFIMSCLPLMCPSTLAYAIPPCMLDINLRHPCWPSLLICYGQRSMRGQA